MCVCLYVDTLRMILLKILYSPMKAAIPSVREVCFLCQFAATTAIEKPSLCEDSQSSSSMCVLLYSCIQDFGFVDSGYVSLFCNTAAKNGHRGNMPSSQSSSSPGNISSQGIPKPYDLGIVKMNNI